MIKDILEDGYRMVGKSRTALTFFLGDSETGSCTMPRTDTDIMILASELAP